MKTAGILSIGIAVVLAWPCSSLGVMNLPYFEDFESVAPGTYWPDQTDDWVAMNGDLSPVVTDAQTASGTQSVADAGTYTGMRTAEFDSGPLTGDQAGIKGISSAHRVLNIHPEGLYEEFPVTLPEVCPLVALLDRKDPRAPGQMTKEGFRRATVPQEIELILSDLQDIGVFRDRVQDNSPCCFPLPEGRTIIHVIGDENAIVLGEFEQVKGNLQGIRADGLADTTEV